MIGPNKLRNAIEHLFETMRKFPDVKPHSARVSTEGKERAPVGSDHAVYSMCNSSGTTKTCTCGWTITVPRQENWGDIREAGNKASAHLLDHAHKGDRQSDPKRKRT